MITARTAGCNDCEWREGPADAKYRDELFFLAKNHYMFSARRHTVYVGVMDCEIEDLKDYSHLTDAATDYQGDAMPTPKLNAYGG